MSTCNLPRKYRPTKLTDIKGQPQIIKSLTAFAKNPERAAFVLAGGSGVGKTATAICLADALGVSVVDEEFGGLLEIPSGQQDGRAVEDLGRSMQLVPMLGSGWRVPIINEADRMTSQAETVWLDLLERLPPRCVVIFTTNDLSKMSDRLLHRCEIFTFEDKAEALRPHLVALAKRVWKEETGRTITNVAKSLGVYDTFSGQASFRLALQQLAQVIRGGQAMPESISVPMMRTEDRYKVAARKAVETRKRNLVGV